MVNKMVRFSSSLFSPKPGQTFTVGSISWFINDNGDGEIVELAQNSTVSIMPRPTLADLISKLPPRSSSSATRRSLPRYPRKQIDNDDLIASIDHVNQKLFQLLVHCRIGPCPTCRQRGVFTTSTSSNDMLRPLRTFLSS